MAQQKYYLKVTIEAGCDDNDKPYQETSFIQRYDTNEQQIAEQTEVFPAIAAVVSEKMLETD